MGCQFSAATGDGGDGVTTFRVYNVDSQGMELNPGKIQVAASDLILYQRGKEPIHWPLRCLRRYGFDAELFSFESGRRCPTGPGIYAFKCRHAETLFNLVQESIQRAGQEDHLRASGGGSGSGSGMGSHGVFTHAARTNSRPASMVDPPEQYGFMMNNGGGEPHVAFDNASQQLYVNGAVSQEAGHQYVNTGAELRRLRGPLGGAFNLRESDPVIGFMSGSGRGQVNYAVLDLPSSMENLLDDSGQGALHNFPRGAPPNNRHSMPGDLAAALAAEDGMMVAGDSDVFLADVDGAGGGMSATYINVNVDEPSPPLDRYYNTAAADQLSVESRGGGVGSAAAGAGGLTVVDRSQGSLPNYANLNLHTTNNGGPPSSRLPSTSSNRQPKSVGVNYIQLDLNNALSDSAGPGGNSNTSPTSPTSMVSVPESPGYATIDFNKTEALSHSTRGAADGEDEPGARKTRHNSTIGT